MISMPSAIVNPTSSAGKEKILFKAVEAARTALEDVANPEEVGEHAGVVVEAERLLTHAFACLKAGYKGWFWTVTVSRIPRSSRVTVNEVARPRMGAVVGQSRALRRVSDGPSALQRRGFAARAGVRADGGGRRSDRPFRDGPGAAESPVKRRARRRIYKVVRGGERP